MSLNEELEAFSYEILLAEVIERARIQRDQAGRSPEGRSLSIEATHLETAALWHCEARAHEHLGDNTLTDWLIGI